MGWSVTLLLISGFSTLHTNLCAEIYFLNMSKKWTEAQCYCRENYTDLVTIDNPEEMNRVINRVNLTGYTGPAWIGLEKGNSCKWQWSLEERRLHSDGQTGFSNWDSGQPDNYEGKEHCVQMYPSGKWNDISCDKTFSFVCYNESGEGDQRYIPINGTKTWKDAQTYCRENHTDLVSVRNQTENDLIHNMTKSGTWVWIGLYRDYWQWSDQRNSSFRYWKLGTPDNGDGNQCAVAWMTATDKGRWDDQKCNGKYPFICYGVPLILVQENKTWNEALNYCRQNYVDLVSVHDDKMQQWVKGKARNATSAHVWLGLRFSCVLNFWFWVSAEPVCYVHWSSCNGTGTGHCGNTGAVQSGGGHQWVSLPDTEELNFICVTC
ncbi:C-type mannose receptor 2-like [Scleropages formosus]|uniref:C-type mannose receptor 2-like n=1 Tax=Scleropages formosus TaxID=113540 RepID=UPI0010FAB39F|nr:C-type mannose receptor 2-like [Scleropages formosus]